MNDLLCNLYEIIPRVSIFALITKEMILADFILVHKTFIHMIRRLVIVIHLFMSINQTGHFTTSSFSIV